jgi:serine/threonine-protein kinase
MMKQEILDQVRVPEQAAGVCVELAVIKGPHTGRRFEFREADRFLVGRGSSAHFRLPLKDKYFSRAHFLIDVNPPLCQLFDLQSRNGTFVNGQRVHESILKSGDVISGGETVFSVEIHDHLDRTCTSAAVGQPLNSDRPELPTIPGFEIISRIGQGGMGCVYRAVRCTDQLPVAIKTILPSVAGTDADYERFLREIRILRKLDHPAIVRYLQEGEFEAMIYLVMELVPGLDAKKLVQRKGQLPIRLAVRLTRQFLDGLQHAHQMGYVHRDIKPANLLIYKEGPSLRVKLADFGLARTYLTTQFSGCTQLGQIGGTIAFMPPEQITRFRDVVPASDQYSAAATLYWMLTGRQIYDFPEPINAQLAMLMSDEPVSIRQRREEIPQALSEIIHRALSRDVSDRFASVAELAKELEGFE